MRCYVYLQATYLYNYTDVSRLFLAQNSKCHCLSSIYNYLTQFLLSLKINVEELIGEAEWYLDLFTDALRKLDMDETMRCGSSCANKL